MSDFAAAELASAILQRLGVMLAAIEQMAKSAVALGLPIAAL